MRTVLCLVLVFLPAFLTQEGINTGEGRQALLFPVNGGGVELATADAKQTLSIYIPLSFTFEGWIMLPSPPADGFYKTIVSRWDIGPDNTFHNRWADFDFQVQASGTLNFFMGNGQPSIYGFNRGVANLAQGQWYHVAFSIDCCGPSATPNVATIYLDLVAYKQSWGFGVRQFPSRSRNIFLGDYFNHDGDHKWWRGYMDEVRFWGYERSVDQLAHWRQRVVPASADGLYAYYRFNEGNGLYLLDSSPKKYNGRLSKPSLTTTSPLWRISGAKIHVDVVVPPLRAVKITLPGASIRPFTYAIESLPTTDGYIGAYGTLIGDGKYIRSTPFALFGNEVTYEAGNLTTGAQVMFSYYGTYDIRDNRQRERQSTIVYIQVQDFPCNPDVCGVCNGDNSTCSCLPLPYAGYSLNDVERILVLYEIEQTLENLYQLDLKIDQAQKTIAQHQATELQVLVSQVQGFISNCVNSFCAKIQKYSDGLAAL